MRGTPDGTMHSLAREDGVPLHADLLAGVARSKILNQRDGINPNAQSVTAIAERLAPTIRDALRQGRPF